MPRPKNVDANGDDAPNGNTHDDRRPKRGAKTAKAHAAPAAAPKSKATKAATVRNGTESKPPAKKMPAAPAAAQTNPKTKAKTASSESKARKEENDEPAPKTTGATKRRRGQPMSSDDAGPSTSSSSEVVAPAAKMRRRGQPPSSDEAAPSTSSSSSSAELVAPATKTTAVAADAQPAQTRRRPGEPATSETGPSSSELVPAKKLKVAAAAIEVLPAIPNDGLEDDEAATLVVWGSGDMGQLGLGEVLEKKRPGRVQDGTKFVNVAACGVHTLALQLKPPVAHDDSGAAPEPRHVLVSMGCNDEFALGRQTEEEEDSHVPGPIPGFPMKHGVAKLCGGDSHSAVLTKDGRVFYWGHFRMGDGPIGLREFKKSEKEPVELELPAGSRKHATGARSPDQIVVDIASGTSHLVVVTQSGKALTFGGFDGGQCGRISERASTNHDARNVEKMLVPARVTMRRSKDSRTVFDACFAGFYGTVLREKGTGRLFACGLNRDRQLGVTPTDPGLSDADREANVERCWKEFFVAPCDVVNSHVDKDAPGLRWKKVALGRDHTLFLAENGKLFVLGRVFYAGVGDGSDVPCFGSKPDDKRLAGLVCLNPLFPDDAEDGRVVDVSANEIVSFAVVEEAADGDGDGRRFLVSWGEQQHGQLGRNTDDDSRTPELVNLGSVVPLKVYAGGAHAAALVRETRADKT